MLYDRPYMQDTRPGARTTVLGWLMAAIVAGYLLQAVVARIFDGGELVERMFALTPAGLARGTCLDAVHVRFPARPGAASAPAYRRQSARPFLPRTGAAAGPGRKAIPVRLRLGGDPGRGRLGRGQLARRRRADRRLGRCDGPFHRLRLLLPEPGDDLPPFFIVPVTIKPKYLAYAAVAVDLVGFLAYEVNGSLSPFGYAHSAHLGGMAAGWLYFRFVHGSSWRLPSRRGAVELPKWMKHAQKSGTPAPPYKVNVGNRENLRAEVDRILDKINSKGFGALTAEEKRLLDEARDLLSRR